jgi:hypothetical protein
MSYQISIEKLRKTVEKIEGRLKGGILRACHKIAQKIELTFETR